MYLILLIFKIEKSLSISKGRVLSRYIWHFFSTSDSMLITTLEDAY